MSNSKDDANRVSEQPAHYGNSKASAQKSPRRSNRHRFLGKKTVRTQADRDRIGKPTLPPEDEWVAELEVVVRRREKARRK
jgi:hypothetical protein